MLDKVGGVSSEKNSALCANELLQLYVDLVVPREVNFPKEACPLEKSAGYTLHRSHKPASDRHLSAFSFEVKKSIVSNNYIKEHIIL